jgi:imidazolonepropionase-like amidohydrolase
MDSNDNLVALVSTDAEFDHFEAVRDEYETGLAQFVASAARDEMAALTALTAQAQGTRSGTLAFIGGTVIDGTGTPPIPNATVVTSQGKIVAVGPSASVKIPRGATRIDVSGKYIIPGLWDMHAHYEQVEWGPIYLAAGVTTVRDVGNEFDFITAVRDAVNSGKALGPRLLLAGVVDGDSPTALGIQRVNSPVQAQQWVQRYHDANFQQIKIYSSVKPDNLKAVCVDAHKLGMTVTGHIPEGMTAIEGVDDGMDQINHINYIARLFLPKDFDAKKATAEERKKAYEQIDVNSPSGQQIVQFFEQHGTVIDPTIALMEIFVKPEGHPLSEIEPGAAKLAPELRQQAESGGVPEKDLAVAQLTLQKRLEIIGALHRAGVTIVAGTDQAVPGFSLYRELELYVQAGFTPLEALQAATIVPAKVMKVDGDSGTVETGKRADLAILLANPLENIHNLRTVQSVVANGVFYQSAPLWQSVGFQP